MSTNTVLNITLIPEYKDSMKVGKSTMRIFCINISDIDKNSNNA